MNIEHVISEHLNIPLQKVNNTVALLKEENTIPFIARYRKEKTGNLDEVQIRNIRDELGKLENLEDRRKTILKSIKDQGALTETLENQIQHAETITALEDLYQPYRPKRRTRGMAAKEKGLEPLADMILEQRISEKDLGELIDPFLTEDVPDQEDALKGACDIAAEKISDNAQIRRIARKKGLAFGKIISEKIPDAKDERRVYELYYNFDLPIKYLKSHQILAINRGENENVLRVHIKIDEKDWLKAIRSQYPPDRRSLFYNDINTTAEDAAKRLLLPSIERDIRRLLTERAEEHAIDIFAKNLKALLSQPPISGHFILGIDPGFRTGSKAVIVDPLGKLLDHATIYPHPPQNKKEEAYRIIQLFINQYNVTLIVIGNGTASRETEMFIAEITRQDPKLSYLITSEAGASVYSASKLARKEFPDLDVSIRGAVSIARRVQDPLAELVKIDPRSIGVGLYQHDVNQTKLTETLDGVVESVVNSVGVEVNSASAPLLTHIAGIGPSLAEKIVAFREENDAFKNREELLNVPGIGAKTFEQSAGFLRIQNGNNPLDATAIHPESYPLADVLYEYLNLTPQSTAKARTNAVEKIRKGDALEKIAIELETGRLTLEDILDEIARPGRDPRKDLPKPILRKDVLSLDDLSQGMSLTGTIRNVVDFGAFVDIGVKTDGLLHRSKFAKEATLKVGDIINVTILSVDNDRKRIALDMNERED